MTFIPIEFSPYTDLALEAREAVLGESQAAALPGVVSDEAQFAWGRVSRVEVTNQEGARLLNKLPGMYITLECPDLRLRNRDITEQVAKQLVQELNELLVLGPETSILVVGLGNWNATPDSLGPRVVGQLLVTRHLEGFVPPEIAGGLRKVAALSPGVLGLTGIETGEIVRGVVDRIKPDLVVCIDALAASSVDRIGTTVQLADSGISPGGGIGNNRVPLNYDTLGVPVFALGVPTVVHATTIANLAVEQLSGQLKGRSRFFDLLAEFSPRERAQLTHEVLHPLFGDLVVTPKEIDDMITNLAKLLAGALNATFHTSVESQEFLKYLN